MDLFVGIDPGQTGALAAIDGTLKVRFLAKAPDSASGHGRPRARGVACGLIRLAVLERTQVMPGNGVVAMHNYGRQAGAWEGVLAALRVPVTQPYPKAWQVLVRAPDCRRGDTKKRSIASAKRLFGVELKRSQDGMADALHMALWALRFSQGVPNPHGLPSLRHRLRLGYAKTPQEFEDEGSYRLFMRIPARAYSRGSR